MVEAFILVQTEVGKAALVAAGVAQIFGVDSAIDVVGPYDVIVRAAGDDAAALDRVIGDVQQIDGITRTLTCRVAREAVAGQAVAGATIVGERGGTRSNDV